jgi:hypothetical protein
MHQHDPNLPPRDPLRDEYTRNTMPMRSDPEPVGAGPFIFAIAILIGIGFLVLGTDWKGQPTTTVTSQRTEAPSSTPITPPRPDIKQPTTPQ